jgi:hypothetical protein
MSSGIYCFSEKNQMRLEFGEWIWSAKMFVNNERESQCKMHEKIIEQHEDQGEATYHKLAIEHLASHAFQMQVPASLAPSPFLVSQTLVSGT